MEFRCPHCNSIVYSRRNKLCGVCGAELPPEVLFTKEEAEAWEKQMLKEKKRAQEFWLPSDS